MNLFIPRVVVEGLLTLWQYLPPPLCRSAVFEVYWHRYLSHYRLIRCLLTAVLYPQVN